MYAETIEEACEAWHQAKSECFEASPHVALVAATVEAEELAKVSESELKVR